MFPSSVAPQSQTQCSHISSQTPLSRALLSREKNKARHQVALTLSSDSWRFPLNRAFQVVLLMHHFRDFHSLLQWLEAFLNSVLWHTVLFLNKTLSPVPPSALVFRDFPLKDCGDRFPARSVLAFSQDYNGFDSFKSFAFGLCIATKPSWPVSLLTVMGSYGLYRFLYSVWLRFFLAS